MFKVCDLQVSIVNEPLVVICHSATHAVVRHRDQCGSGGVGSGGVDESPLNRAVLAVVDDLPDTGFCFDQRLVSIVVELRSKSLTRRRGERGVGDFGVLVELISRVDGIRAARTQSRGCRCRQSRMRSGSRNQPLQRRS